jgi:hypothetical protein
VTIDIPGVVVTQRRTWPDQRGDFLELFRSDEYADAFVQVNHSFSRANVLRVLHYHRHQADLWYIVRGLAQVALADLRGDRAHVEVFDLAPVGHDHHIPPARRIPRDRRRGHAVRGDPPYDPMTSTAWRGTPELGIVARARSGAERARSPAPAAWTDPLARDRGDGRVSRARGCFCRPPASPRVTSWT